MFHARLDNRGFEVWDLGVQGFRGSAHRVTSLIRNHLPLGPYHRPMPRVLGWSKGGGRFLMSDVPL